MGKKESDEVWCLAEDFSSKEGGPAKMDEAGNHAFVRSHRSNARRLCFECCVHENCRKKRKMENESMKWSLLVDSHEHADAMESVPSRKNGLAVK